jgi:hypothetical protein
MSRKVGEQPWFVNCWGGGADAFGHVSHSLMAAAAEEAEDRSAREVTSRGTPEKHKPEVEE